MKNRPLLLGIMLIAGNVAAFLHDQLAGKWPANWHDWAILLLAVITEAGTATGLYHITPRPAAPTSL